jgi:hypothetical protein
MNWEDRTVDYYLRRLFNQLEMGEFATSMDVERAYRQTVGDRISAYTQTLRYKNGTLRIRLIPAAALRQEMTWRRESLREKMNEHLGGNVVKKIMIY